LAVFDLKTKQNVLQLNDIPTPSRLLIDETDSILYMLSGASILQKYDISKLPTGGRANLLVSSINLYPTSVITTLGGYIAYSSHNGNLTYWGYDYCKDDDNFWSTAMPNSQSCVNTGGGLPNDFSFPLVPTDIMIAPDQQAMLLSFSAKMPFLPTVNFPDNCNDVMTTCWVMDANVAAFDVVKVPDPYYGWLSATMGFSFGSAGVSRLVSVGPRFYAINDAFLYSGDFSGTTYPPLQIGGHLTGMTYGYDGKLYVSEGDSGMVYPITLGKTPSHDRIEKGYKMPPRFSPGTLVVAPPAGCCGVCS